MKIVIFIILLFTSVCFGDIYTSHQYPITDSTLNLGSLELLWRYIYGDSFTDGTALWDDNSLSGFTSISGLTLTDTILIINNGSITSAIDGTFSGTITDGTFIVSSGVITGATWNGVAIDISDYTNLVAGTNITLSGDILNVDDAFLVNDASDTTSGTLTAAGFTTTGTATTDVLIVGSNAPATITSTGIAGTITYDSDYIYMCIATNSWLRVALASWGVAAGDTMLYEDDNTMVFEDGNTMVYD